MRARKITDRVSWLGAIDWNRRLFDALIPLPEGTSYNAYLVRGSEKTVIIDSVDESMENYLLTQLADVDHIDYIICQHAEQDHSGSIPALMKRYPKATVICSQRAKEMIVEHLHVDPEKIQTVADGESINLGDCSLRFISTPWVHWPETMCTYLEEEQILFSCDFFGSHLATTNLYAGDNLLVLHDAKRYYAEIMMPFRKQIQNNLKKLDQLDIKLIAPSHGPLFDKPEVIINSYKRWSSNEVENRVVIPYISMHGSTKIMVEYLLHALVDLGIEVQPFDLTVADLGDLAISLVDAATMVIGTPTVNVGPHPHVVGAVYLANSLKPKTRFTAVIGSYGWGNKTVDQISAMIPNIKAEMLGSFLCKGLPRDMDMKELDNLAQTISQKHREIFDF